MTLHEIQRFLCSRNHRIKSGGATHNVVSFGKSFHICFVWCQLFSVETMGVKTELLLALRFDTHGQCVVQG